MKPIEDGIKVADLLFKCPIVSENLHHSTRSISGQIANIVVAAPPPSTVTMMTSNLLPNGLSSPLLDSALTNEDAPYDSESDLSEVAIPIIDEPSPAPSNHQSEFGEQAEVHSESSGAEAQDASDDADFDMEDSPAPVASSGRRDDRSSSAESRRPPKRKLGVEDDEHILANPELYGLRRSVSRDHF